MSLNPSQLQDTFEMKGKGGLICVPIIRTLNAISQMMGNNPQGSGPVFLHVDQVMPVAVHVVG